MGSPGLRGSMAGRWAVATAATLVAGLLVGGCSNSPSSAGSSSPKPSLSTSQSAQPVVAGTRVTYVNDTPQTVTVAAQDGTASLGVPVDVPAGQSTTLADDPCRGACSTGVDAVVNFSDGGGELSVQLHNRASGNPSVFWCYRSECDSEVKYSEGESQRHQLKDPNGDRRATMTITREPDDGDFRVWTVTLV